MTTTNERLRDALMRSQIDREDFARQLEVDAKTVERWITQGRVPYPRTRAKASTILGESQSYLWPDALSDRQKLEVSESELVRLYPRRSQVETETWIRLLDEATERIDILAFAGLFLPERLPKLAKTLCAKSKKGAQVRILLGDPDGEEVGRRGDEERIGDSLRAKVRNVLAFYDEHVDHGCCEIRLHNTVLYNSIYRFDSEMLVNSHILGLPAAHAPVLRIRQLPGGELFDVYAENFDYIWDRSAPVSEQLRKAG